MNAENYIKSVVVRGFDQAEYVSKADALKAVEMTRNEADKFKNLALSLLDSIADAITNMEVGNYDCGKLYIPSFRYKSYFEFTENDVITIKELAKNDTEQCAIDLMNWFKEAKEA